jgi:hypothetical protein
MGNFTRQDRINLRKNQVGISAGEGTLENLVEGIPQFRTEIDHETGRQKTVQYIKNGLDVVKSEFKNLDDTELIPVIAGYPAFGITQSSSSDAQEIASGAYETIVFDEKLYDNGGNFSTSNYSFTVPINGIYNFYARILWDGNESAGDGDWAAEDYNQISLVKNDRTTVPDAADIVAQTRNTIQGTVTDVYLSNNITSDLILNAGDYISVAVYHNTAAGHSQFTYQPTNTYLWTSFTGHLVCAI